MMKWQTNQMEATPTLDPAQQSKYLSIRIVPDAIEQCFHFSFCIGATGVQFRQVVTS
jgi:hypothetical protein